MKSSARDRFVVGAALFAIAFAVFAASPVVDNADSRYSMVLSESILRHHSSHLDAYLFPGTIAEMSTSTPPTIDPPNPQTYELGRVNGHVVYLFPNGSSVLSIPFVALMNTLSVRATNADGTCNVRGEMLIQKMLAALLMAILTCIVFRTANLLCSTEVSLVVALSVGFGTQVWSVATRGLWSHTWLILLGTIAGWTILRAEIQRRDIPAIFLATILAWMYFVRPTAAIPILCVLCYLCVYHRKALGTFAVTGGLWLGAFVTYSWFTFHEILPGYYLASRLRFEGISTALAGILISPSRGLFVYVPSLLFVGYLIVRYWRELPCRRVAYLSLAITAMEIISVAGFPNWWGGGSYGPRLLTDVVPWAVLVAIIGLAGARRVHMSGLTNPELAAACALVLLAIVINARGALSVRAHHVWNLEMVVDRHPERNFDWSYPQFAAGLVAPPNYVSWRYPNESSTRAVTTPGVSQTISISEQSAHCHH